jgi:hypothetical protein
VRRRAVLAVLQLLLRSYLRLDLDLELRLHLGFRVHLLRCSAAVHLRHVECVRAGGHVALQLRELLRLHLRW